MVVVKFGGTSVENAFAMVKAFSIIKDLADKKVIVVLSACAGITNRLIKVSEIACKDGYEKCNSIFDEIKNHHIALINQLFTNQNRLEKTSQEINLLIDKLEKILSGIALLGELDNRIKDEVLSFGEILSSTIFFNYCEEQKFNTKFLDSREIIKTNSNFNSADIDFKSTNENITNYVLPLFDNFNVLISQGFIASDSQNVTTTIGRGGSDYSAAIYGAGLNVEAIQIWTDVSGVMTADPRQFPKAKTIPNMSYDEIVTLSFFGAKVLHPDTIEPALTKNIPVKVLNTFDVSAGFTTITNNIFSQIPRINSLIYKNDCVLFDLKFKVNTFSNQLNTLNSAGFKVLVSNFTNNKLQILTEFCDNFDYLNDINFEYQKVNAVVLCGNSLNIISGATLIEIFKMANDSKVNITIFNHSVNSIVLISKDNLLEFAKLIHDFIVKE